MLPASDRPGLESLQPGDILIGSIGGVVPGLFPVAFGQLVLAPAERRRTARDWWNFRHVAVVVESHLDTEIGTEKSPQTWPVHGPKIAQAMPSGAEEVEIGAEHWRNEYLYIRPRWQWMDQGQLVADRARHYVAVHTPYSFVDYLALAAHRLTDGQRYKDLEDRTALDRYVAGSRRMICSQLVDQCLADAGYHVFTDGRLPQDVMPAELACRLLALPGEHLRPGDGAWFSNGAWPECCSGVRL